MEKINNYTPGKWSVDDGEHEYSVRVNIGRQHPHKLLEFALVTGARCKANAQLISLSPTLYEQHFKMLEALKRVDELRSILQKMQTLIDYKDIDLKMEWNQLSQFITDSEQTIKECEL